MTAQTPDNDVGVLISEIQTPDNDVEVLISKILMQHGITRPLVKGLTTEQAYELGRLKENVMIFCQEQSSQEEKLDILDRVSSKYIARLQGAKNSEEEYTYRRLARMPANLTGYFNAPVKSLKLDAQRYLNCYYYGFTGILSDLGSTLINKFRAADEKPSLQDQYSFLVSNMAKFNLKALEAYLKEYPPVDIDLQKQSNWIPLSPEMVDGMQKMADFAAEKGAHNIAGILKAYSGHAFPESAMENEAETSARIQKMQRSSAALKNG